MERLAPAVHRTPGRPFDATTRRRRVHARETTEGADRRGGDPPTEDMRRSWKPRVQANRARRMTVNRFRRGRMRLGLAGSVVAIALILQIAGVVVETYMAGAS